jgi:Flp pilus assembly protein protease CpaA
MIFFGIALITALLACALYDLVAFRIPNALSAVTLLFISWALLQLPAAGVTGAVLVALTVFVGAALAFQLGLLGGDDIKLLVGTCLWAGPYAFLPHLLA